MATLQKIRNRAGILVAGVIGLALLAFILGDLFQTGSSIFRKTQNEIANVNGESVQYLDFQKKVESLGEIYKMNSGKSQLDENTQVQIREQTWENVVRDIVMSDVYDELGLAVSSDELFDMIQGNNIHPIVRQIFQNPNTGQVDRNVIVNFLKNLETNVKPEQRAYWLYLEQQIQDEKILSKYNNLVAKGLYVTSAEAQNSLKNKNRQVNIEYVSLPYSSIPDSQVTVTEKDLKNYYDNHTDEYKVEKTRRIEYISFPVTASAQDNIAAKKWIDEIKNDFAQTTDNVQFVNSNSDNGFEDTWYSKTTLPQLLNGWAFNETTKVNDVYGPYFEGDSYKLAKLHKLEMVPDSVEARHILLQVTSADEVKAKQALADSLKKAIENGSDFGVLARQYSSDKGSAVKGGDLGYFAHGQMVKPFEEAAFNNKTGEVSIAVSQFGIHIIQTTRRSAESLQAQLAVLVRKVVPSDATYQNIYAQASKFASENTDKEKFEAAVTSQKLNKKVATVQENDRDIAGLESARPLIRAAFEAEEGDILADFRQSVIFELGDNFVIAALVSATEKGISPFNDVKSRVELAVLKDKKGDLLAEKANNILKSQSDLIVIAHSLNSEVKTASNINFNSVSLPGIGIEPKLTGVATTIGTGKISTPVKGNNSVFIVKAVSETLGTDKDQAAEQARLAQNVAYRANYQAYETQKKAVEIVDKRSKFY